jgi:hypothetical protein
VVASRVSILPRKRSHDGAPRSTVVGQNLD